MSRSGYSDNLEPLDLGRWRGMVASATRGKRGQKLFTDLAAALDAMPVKRLIADNLVDADNGSVCALGALGQMRGIDMTNIDPHDPDTVANTFDVATCLAQEVVYTNDEGAYRETPEARWQRVRDWVGAQINKSTS